MNLYFNEKMLNQDQFIHDYLRFSKPYDYWVDWDNFCSLIVRIINLKDERFYTLSRRDTKDGYEHSFEFERFIIRGLTYTKYIGYL